MIDLTIKHWYYDFTEDDFLRCSTHKTEQEKKSALIKSLEKSAILKDTKQVSIDETQILCANEVFPEIAISDPLSDLRIWDKWRSGVRNFPYPGRYAKLSITEQSSKSSSPSSTGVIGEIVAGIIGQSIIGPDVLVRVIRRWPDFIWFPFNNRYSFLEAKASTTSNNSSGKFSDLDREELKKGLSDTVNEFLVDPRLKIWYSFTQITSITPIISFTTNLFEFDNSRSFKNRIVPNLIISGLAERAIQRGLTSDYIVKSVCERNPFRDKRKNNKDRQKAQSKLIKISKECLDGILDDIPYFYRLEIDRNELESSIEEQISNLVLSDREMDPEYLYNSYNYERRYQITLIRSMAKQSICAIEIPKYKREELVEEWKPNLETVNSPYSTIENHKLWKFGSFLFFMCNKNEQSLLDTIQQTVNTFWDNH